MEKKYQDPNLIKYFEKHVAKMNVEDTFKPLLVDILLRRAYEFFTRFFRYNQNW